MIHVNLKALVISIVICSAIVVLVGCTKRRPEPVEEPAIPAVTPVNAARLATANTDAANWLTYGRTYDEQRFSPLSQVNRETVRSLKVAWYLDLGSDERGQQATPLVVDGRLYTSTSWSRVHALDASTGRVLWRYDPAVPREWGINACCDVVSRGLAVWEDKIYVATIDGRLVAMDATSGRPLWETLVIDRAERSSVTGAPRAIKGKIYIGSAGGEFDTRGRLTAVDANTGAVLWRFFTVPGDPSQRVENPHLSTAVATWSGTWWLRGGGGTVWDSMSYDPDLDMLYVGTGNGSPWPQSARSPNGGDNLFVSSILAIRAETGELAWHYQTTPGDEWGFDAASQLILTDILVGAQTRKVIMQASANGFYYVLDRVDGTLISATPFVPTTWASRIDLVTGRPVEAPHARYSRTQQPFVVQPGPLGAHSWQPMSFSPLTGLVYIPAQINGAELSVGKDKAVSRYRLGTGTSISRPTNLPPERSELIAWDPVSQRPEWVIQRETPVASGVLTTAGSLLFQGSTSGKFEAFDAANGNRLWEHFAGAPITAPPVTYLVNETQFVAVLAGAGGGRMLEGGAQMRTQTPATGAARLVAYSLNGSAILPSTEIAPTAPNLPSLNGAADTRGRGKDLYASYCARCHGADVINSGPLRPLTASVHLGDSNQWNLITFAGLKEKSGMPGFMAELSRDDVEAIRQYVVTRAHELYADAQGTNPTR